MKLPEFIVEYCGDIVAEHKKRKNLLDNPIFTYDDIIDIDGESVKVVIDADGTAIPIQDILMFNEENFRAVHPSDASFESYRRYLDTFIMISGEELTTQIRREVEEEQMRLRNFSELSCDGLTCEF